jgi:hypothetical protein
MCRSQWPRGLRRRSSAARLLRLWVWIPPGSWMFASCECCVLSGRGLCDGLITRPEESYRLWRVVVCDQETSKTKSLKPATGLWKIKPQWVVTSKKQTKKQLILLVCVTLVLNPETQFAALQVYCEYTSLSWNYEVQMKAVTGIAPCNVPVFSFVSQTAV